MKKIWCYLTIVVLSFAILTSSVNIAKAETISHEVLTEKTWYLESGNTIMLMRFMNEPFPRGGASEKCGVVRMVALQRTNNDMLDLLSTTEGIYEIVDDTIVKVYVFDDGYDSISVSEFSFDGSNLLSSGLVLNPVE